MNTLPSNTKPLLALLGMLLFVVSSQARYSPNPVDTATVQLRAHSFGRKYRVKNREEGDYGIPLKKAVPILAYFLSSAQNDVEHGWMQSNFPYFYNLPLVYKQDWVDLHSQILNDYVKGLIPSGSTAESLRTSALCAMVGLPLICSMYYQ